MYPNQYSYDLDVNYNGSIYILADDNRGLALFNTSNGLMINSTSHLYGSGTNGSGYIRVCKYSKDYSMIAYAGYKFSSVLASIVIIN